MTIRKLKIVSLLKMSCEKRPGLAFDNQQLCQQGTSENRSITSKYNIHFVFDS